MPQTYLLVEGINIYSNVLDTDQLSVIRGSSFVLKLAIERIKSHCEDSLDPVSTGASSGLFLLKEEKIDLAALVADITRELEIPPFCHFTFAIEHCQAKDLLQAKEQLLAQLRFHQMCAISMVPDRFAQELQREAFPCQLEGRRIAATNTERRVQGNYRKLSLSTCERLDFGRKQRQDFYFREGDIGASDELKHYSFTDDLEHLAGDSHSAKLNNKIAVIYMDGNKFSSIQRGMLQHAQENKTDQIAAQKEFDDDIQGKRATFLKKTLEEMVKSEHSISRFPHAITHNSDDKDKKIIRFETLLWGGDEMLFVLPAVSGFELLQSFFQVSADWAIGEEPLTHAAGIVFCNVKTPIRIIREVAESLADTIKDKLGDERKRNTWDYMVLESIDYPLDKDIDLFNRARYGKALAERRPHYFPPAENWDGSKKDLARLITDGLLSRRQLYRIVDTLKKPADSATISWSKLVASNSKELDERSPPASPRERAEHRLLQLLDQGQRSALEEILPRLARDLFAIDIECAGSRAWLWLNLIELWDYLLPAKGGN